MKRIILSVVVLIFGAASLLGQSNVKVPTNNVNVPTLSEWGLIILAISLLVFGVVSISSKKKTKEVRDI